ncbi:MAG: MCP four helix bundle domain-containing protein [Verrucomicrobiota bacterium]
MFKRELLIVALVLSTLVLATAGAGLYAINALNQIAENIVIDTLPGLATAGMATGRMNDNRHTMREMLVAKTGAECEQLMKQLEANRTDALWRDYEKSINESKDRNNFQNMMLVRSNYIKGYEKFCSLVLAGKKSEAESFYNGEFFRQFSAYNTAAKCLFDYNVKQGVVRGNSLMRATAFAPWLIGVFCVPLFIIGYALGLRTSLSGGGGK